jgi:hypothetical protein
MTDTERRAQEAKRLLEENKPYFDLIERDAYEALLAGKEMADVLDGRLFILAIRKFRAALDTAIMRGVQEARKAPTVA